LKLIISVPQKLYSGAIVNYPANNFAGNAAVMRLLVESIKELHLSLNINKKFNKPDAELNSYDVAHHAGMQLEEEYEFLQLMHELQRQEYLKRHLKKVLPIVKEMENLKAKVKLNGHFKNLEGFNINK
jgi:uncharacterized protein